MYLELHAASAFSFLDGASLPEALVDQASALGYPAMALMDRDGVYGAPRFYQAARKAGIRALVGAELTMRTGGPVTPSSASLRPPLIWRLPVLVESAQGYAALCRLVTRMKLGAAKGQGALALHDLDGQVGGLVALVGRPLLAADRHGVTGLLDQVVGVFGRHQVRVEIQRHLTRDEEADNRILLAAAEAYRVEVIATNGVRFATPDARPLYDVLTCIRHGTTLAHAGRRLAVNAERYLKSPRQMQALFSDLPQALANSVALGDRLQFTLANLGYRFPDYPVPDGETQMSFLRRITEAGAHWRYRPYGERAQRQIGRELDLIEKLDLAGYFLIVWDLVNFCRQQDILAQGRGSAANSAVCYSLGITAVDPIGMDLLFERFLSEERGEWPDIDLDLPSGDRREQVIQYLYRRYGTYGAAMTANVITYRGRSAAREVGKVLDCPAPVIDRLARLMSPFEWQDPADTLARHLRDLGVDPDQPQIQQFGALWMRMQDIPRHLGQHSGGMVLCQGRLDDIVPLEPASMPDRVVVQWDKDDCADMGIVKVDLLGLGMLAVLQEAITIVNGAATSTAGDIVADDDPDGMHRPVIDLAHLPPDDPVVYRMLQEADTVGLFQVESRAQMATLPRLEPRCFYDLVVEVAIIRPGPIVGQMVHPYLARRRGDEPVTYAHPALEPILARTLGVPLFQEQLLRMAMVVAGFSGGEAEELRRAMGFKRSEARMRQIEGRLLSGMAERGITGETAQTILRSISSFALYGFPESHAASFALIVYASAYLKAYYPAAFVTALLNNQPLGFYHPATLIKDAQRHGVRFLPVDVQHSAWPCRITADGAVRLGFCMVQGLRQETGRKLAGSGEAAVAGAGAGDPDPAPPFVCPKCGADDPSMFEIEVRNDTRHLYCSVCAHDWRDGSGGGSRESGVGRFPSLDALVSATGIRRDELNTLASLGALNSLGFDRRSALWEAERVVRPTGDLFADVDDQAPPIRVEGKQAESIVAPNPPDPARAERREASPLAAMTPMERIVADYRGSGVTIGPHPMAMRRADLRLRGVLRSDELVRTRSGRRVRVAGAVITRQRPGTAKGMVFLTLEDEAGLANVIVRPDVFDTQRVLIMQAPFLVVEGVLQQQQGVTSVRAERVMGFAGAQPSTPSHDFR
ncbi:MAG: error-prone DNA polymerase [Acidobacteria bacterium]|nr:error-prone DNA polymerase [Acidobacteriota bacterium]